MEGSGTSECGEARKDLPLLSLRLYIAGDTDLSRRAELNLRQIIDEVLPQQYLLEVIDVVINPRLAIEGRVTITPMAVTMSPPPVRKVIGDFTDRSRVLSGLGIQHATGRRGN